MGAVNPYVGPRPFETGEPLFGRDRELRELPDLLGAERILLLHSPSGAGKSSLVQAGLIPRMRRRFDVWRPTRVSLPVPEAAANRHVLSAVLGFEQGIPAQLRRPATELARASLAEYVEDRPRRAEAPDNVLLIFDQFEEVLTVDPLALDAKRAFFAELGALLANPRVWALFVLREDYLAPLDPYASLVPTHLKNRYRIDRLGLEAAREAIVGPTKGLARQWNEEAIERLVRDLATVKVQQADGSFVEQAGYHVEPMQLQVVCRGLWDRLPADELMIDAEDLAAFGDVTHALADYYAQTVGRIAGDERALRAWIGEKLISSDGIRTPVLRGAGASEGLANEAITRLVDAHLVRADHRGGAIWYELAHDRLVRPVRADNERWAEANLHPVQVQAAQWARRGQPAGLLLPEGALAEAELWARERTLGEPDASFMAASRAARAQERALREAQAQALAAAQEKARRERVLKQVAVLLGLIALGTALMIGVQCRTAREQTQQAQHEATRAQDQVRMSAIREAGTDPDTALVTALLREVELPDEAYLWTNSAIEMWNAVVPTAVLRHEAGVATAVFAGDGSRVLTASEDTTARVWAVDGLGAPVVLRGHASGLLAASFSRDGSRILTVATDRTARVWRADGGASIELGAGAVERACFAPDGQRVALALAGGEVAVWRADGTGAPVLLRGATGLFEVLRFSPDGTRIAAASLDMRAYVWRADGSGAPVVFAGHEHMVEDVAFSPDGARVVSASRDATARVWSSDDGGAVVTLAGHEEAVYAAAFSPDGTRVATASRDRTVRVWPADGSAAPLVLTGHGDDVTAVGFSADGTRVLSAGLDRTARVWRADGAGAPVVLGGHGGAVRTAVFAGDGSRVVTASNDGTARVFRVDRPPRPTMLPARGVVETARFSADGQAVLTASWDGTAALWRADGAGAPVLLRGHTEEVRGAAYSPDGRRILTFSGDRTVRVWDADGRSTAVLTADALVYWAAFSADGRRVASGWEDGAVRVWGADGREAPVVLRAEEPVGWVGFTPDGQRVVGTSSRKVQVWRADGTGEAVVLGRFEQPIPGTAIAPDGARVVAASRDRTARVWPIDGGEPVVLRGHAGDVVDAAFSRDGQRVVTASDDRTARVWPVGGGEPVVLKGHTEGVVAARFSDDGGRVITASADGTARVWWLDGSAAVVVLKAHTAGLQSAEFSPDGTRVVTASADWTARVWTFATTEVYGDYLWRATTYCLPLDLRTSRLGEPADRAAENLRRCESRVAGLAREGAYR